MFSKRLTVGRSVPVRPIPVRSSLQCWTRFSSPLSSVLCFHQICSFRASESPDHWTLPTWASWTSSSTNSGHEVGRPRLHPQPSCWSGLESGTSPRRLQETPSGRKAEDYYWGMFKRKPQRLQDVLSSRGQNSTWRRRWADGDTRATVASDVIQWLINNHIRLWVTPELPLFILIIFLHPDTGRYYTLARSCSLFRGASHIKQFVGTNSFRNSPHRNYTRNHRHWF